MKSSTSSSPRSLRRSPNETPSLNVCVACGSTRVQRKRVSVRLRDGRSVTGIEADVCAACGERYYDVQAMERLEAVGGSSRTE